MSILCWLSILFGVAGIVFGLWRYQQELHWYAAWHSAKRQDSHDE